MAWYLETPAHWVLCVSVTRGLLGTSAVTYLNETLRGLKERRVGKSVILEKI